MKRSEAIKKLMTKVVSPYEIITQANYENGVYRDRAERLLTFIEKELKMLPPNIKVVKAKSRKTGIEYIKPIVISGWEPEDE